LRNRFGEDTRGESIMRFLTVHLMTLLILVFSQVGQAHHTALPEGMSKEQAAWLWGYHTIPASITLDGSPYWYGYNHTDVNKIDNPAWSQVAKGHIKSGAKAPAVLMMHGCSGIIRSPAAYRVFLMELGFAVIEPDSFARPGHTCKYGALDARTADLDHAYKMLRQLPWVDQNRIVLMGISQGGAAVARWDQPGFAAHIILANNCDGGKPRAPEGIPVVAVVGEEDEHSKGSSCDVKRKIKGSQSVVIPNAPHGIIDYPEAEQAMKQMFEMADLL
jgi:dienelactone hydrolase